MRPLNEDEWKLVLEKLSKYIGANSKYLINRTDEEWVFMLHERRVWYMSKRLKDMAVHFARDSLRGCGVAFGRFTHHGRFRLDVTCLDFLSQYAQYKIWVKPNQEQSYLYGNNVTRAGLGRITQGTPRYQGVVVYNMADVPLGFGVSALSTTACTKCETNAMVLFHETDVAEYLRNEDHLAS
jgi:60S ribosome subunit biogenesis protein NIP7